MPTNETERSETSVPGHVASTERLGLVEKAPRWWHCDTHGAGSLSAWGCPECTAELRRWKSTNAPRLEALEGLLRTAQLEAHGAREAIATLASEREANSMLTERVRLLELAEEGAKEAFGHIVDMKQAAEKECMRLQGLLAAAYADIRRLSRA